MSSKSSKGKGLQITVTTSSYGLSESLSGSFGKGFSKRNLELMRQFYLTYRIAKSPISQSLSWTHYIRLMRISDPDERRFYEIEAANNNWSESSTGSLTLPSINAWP